MVQVVEKIAIVDTVCYSKYCVMQSPCSLEVRSQHEMISRCSNNTPASYPVTYVQLVESIPARIVIC